MTREKKEKRKYIYQSVSTDFSEVERDGARLVLVTQSCVSTRISLAVLKSVMMGIVRLRRKVRLTGGAIRTAVRARCMALLMRTIASRISTYGARNVRQLDRVECI
jgi:hypothetical protein